MAQNTMYPGIDNSPKTTITLALAAADTSIAIENTAVLPDAPNLATIGTGDNAEVILYNAIEGNVLTGCVRGVGGTARVWSAGTNIYRAYTNKDHQTFIDNIKDLDNRKLSTDGVGSDLTLNFTEAEQKANITTGEKLSVIAGKIAKWFSSFGAAAWLGVGSSENTVAAGKHAEQHKTGGMDALAASDIGAAASIHAANHKTGGTDAIAPADIGAAASSHAHGSITTDGKVGSTADLPLFTLVGGAVGTKSKSDARIALDIEARGFEYGGRVIPYSWAEIQAKIKAADFTGLRVGDYKDITLNRAFYDAAADADKTMSSAVFRMEIAGIDSYYQYGDTAVPHHIDFISRDCYATALLYNATATNSGAYLGSALFTTLNGSRGIVSLLPADVAAVIISKRGLTETKTAADTTGWAWNDMGKLWLPTEQEVWGHVTWAEHKYGGGLSVHYPIFQHGLRHIIKGAGHGGGRCNWWCASSMAGSAANFCFVNYSGFPYNASATGAGVRVPLCFRVA